MINATTKATWERKSLRVQSTVARKARQKELEASGPLHPVKKQRVMDTSTEITSFFSPGSQAVE